MRHHTALLRSCGTLGLLLAAVVAPGAGQDLPRLAGDGCRSEQDARLAFGLCPERRFDFYAEGPYREGVPRPEDVLGYPVGAWHTPYGRMERYLAALAPAAAGRLTVLDYGLSVERRTLHLVAVSSETNIARLEGIRDGLRRLADPRETTVEEAAGIIAGTPVVV